MREETFEAREMFKSKSKALSVSKRKIRIVVISTTGKHVSGDIYVSKHERFSDGMKVFNDRDYITLSNVIYEGMNLPLFLVYKTAILGVLPADIEAL